MKQFFLIILMLLPYFGTQATPIQNNTPIVQQVDSVDYNEVLIEDLSYAVENKDFTYFIEEHFTDTIYVYSEIDDIITETNASVFLASINYVFQNTHMYSYEIYYSEVDGEGVYKLNYYVIMIDDAGEASLGLIVLNFAENKDGQINLVLGQ